VIKELAADIPYRGMVIIKQLGGYYSVSYFGHSGVARLFEETFKSIGAAKEFIDMQTVEKYRGYSIRYLGIYVGQFRWQIYTPKGKPLDDKANTLDVAKKHIDWRISKGKDNLTRI
jgi:hypothetical protein